MSPIPIDTILKGETVELIPLQKAHFKELEIISQDKNIWQFMTVDGSAAGRCNKLLNEALQEREKGTQFPFVIYHKKEKRLIGSTRLMEIVPAHNKLEIGWTWLQPAYWATAINPECKLLLLTFCFEVLEVMRVQFKTNEKNFRSRKAIAKTGAQFEGILRNDMLLENGTRRNTAYFSIIDTEWPTSKATLQQLLQLRRTEQ